jgi:hypothetical protein
MDKQNLIKKYKFHLLVIIGTILWSLTMVKSGITYSYGMGFWGPNGHDGVWHIALARSLAGGSWEMPIYAGETIKNYHIGLDLILAVLHKLTFIPIHTLYFQILPPILAILIGLYSYRFIFIWTKDKAKAYWGTFFVYFGGSFGWIITLLKNGELAGESVFWSQQSISTLINPPFALSLVLIFSGLYYLIKGVTNNAKRELVLATFLFGVLVQIKVYAGILILASIFAAGMWNIWKRKGLVLIKIFTGSLVISVLLFSPTSEEIGRVLIYKPFWFLETMMVFGDRVGWVKFGEAMVNYKLGGVWHKAVLAYGFSLLLFSAGNFGTRLLSLNWFWKRRNIFKHYQYIDVLIVTLIVTGIIIPLLFIQNGTPWNTIQFMYYSLMFSGVLAGVSFGDLLKNSRLNVLMIRIISTVVVVLTIATILGVLYYHYLPSRPPAMISKSELEALDFLAKQPDGVVLTQPFDKAKADEAVSNPPRPLYLYESTAYVSAFSGKETYLEDEVNLEITGYDWRIRRKNSEAFFADSSSEVSYDLLENNNISYLYVIKTLLTESSDLSPDKNKIFENGEVLIYRVN